MTRLNFKMRGKRDHVYGPDIYNRLIEFLRENEATEVRDIDLSFRAPISHQLDAELTFGPNLERRPNTAAVFKGRCERGPFMVQLMESSEAVAESCEYDESRIVQAARMNLDTKQIEMSGFNDYSVIHCLVSMNKALLLNLFPKECEGKRWFFVKFAAARPLPMDKTRYQVELQPPYQTRMTQSLVRLDGEPAGTIYFKLVGDH